MDEKFQKGFNILKKELKKCPFSCATNQSNAYCLRGVKLSREMVGENIIKGSFNTIEEFFAQIENSGLGKDALETIPCKAWESKPRGHCILVEKNIV